MDSFFALTEAHQHSIAVESMDDPVSQREISNKASNVASRGELGRLLLIINIYKNIPYYTLYLLRKNEDILLLNKTFVPR